MKLTDDPRVATLVEKSIAAALKAERRRAAADVKAVLDLAISAAQGGGPYTAKSLRALRSDLLLALASPPVPA